MFGGSLFGMFDEDPFFRDQNRRIQEMHSQMSRMMGGMFVDPFMPALEGPSHHSLHHRNAHARAHARAHGGELAPMGMFGGDIFGHMMTNMRNMSPMNAMMERGTTDPNGAFYSESRIMSFSSNGSGQPQVYEATSSTTQAPGGIRETRKTVRDTAAGVQKMAVGRHIRDRGHVIARERNTRTGDQEENHDYINLDEEEADAFNEEFRQRTEQHRSRAGPTRRHHHQGALTDGRGGSRYDPRGRHALPALEYRDHRH